MQEQITKNSKDKINKKHFIILKPWSLSVFAITLLITSLFVLSAFAQSETKTSLIINLTNKERAERGLVTLSENKTLDKAAYNKARDMFKYQYFEHVSPQGKTPWSFINQAGYDYSYAGENLAVDFEDLESTQKAWMLSPGHKANIINPNYREIGVASVTDQFNGKTTTITVEMFGTSMFDTVLNNINKIW